VLCCQTTKYKFLKWALHSVKLEEMVLEDPTHSTSLSHDFVNISINKDIKTHLKLMFANINTFWAAKE